MVDATGLKVYGKDEWQQEKHGCPPEVQVVGATAQASAQETRNVTGIRVIEEDRRIGWQKKTNYGLPSGHPALQGPHRQRHESTRFGTVKDAGVIQCVCTEPDDKSWDARVDKNLKRVRKRGTVANFRFLHNVFGWGLAIKERPAAVMRRRDIS